MNMKAMAVIQRTECRGMSIRLLTQGIFFVFVLAGVQCGPARECDQARKDVELAKLPSTWLQDQPAGGDVCGTNSCCSLQSEQEMFPQSKHQLEAFLRDSITRLSSLIDSRAKKFDGLFREMMNTSKIEFHEMFQKTYGKIYLQNSDVFSDFFKELESYYKKGSTRLSDTLESFFVILYQRMFTVINKQYSFDDKYLDCISDHMKDVKPFGDAPQKFTLQLKRSFIATRTYYKALSTAAEVARKLVNVGIDKDCEKEMVKMRYCGSCNGLRGAGTCYDYCSAVMQGCLRHHIEFNKEWDNFVDALEKVADRLVGPYNIEIVVEPLNIKISEAIMNFQESGTEVSDKIYSYCGKPSLNRRKRKAGFKDGGEDNASYEVKTSPMKGMGGGHKKKKNKKYEEEDEGPSLGRLIKEIKVKIRDAHQFWKQLPYQYCNTLAAPPSATGKCWNGTSIGEYGAHPKVPPGNSSIVNEQVYALQRFSDQLRKAYNGEEVDFPDDTEEFIDGSGSGSGDDGFDGKEEPEVEEPDLVFEPKIPDVQPPPSTSRPDAPRSTTGAAATMSLNKALAQFLVPIVLVWFGGAISDLL